MKTPPLTFLPALSRTIDSDKLRSQYLRQASAIAKDLNPSSSKFTLNDAKRIWATYSSRDSIDKPVETEVASNTNALDLHLGDAGFSAISRADMTGYFANGASTVTMRTAATHRSSYDSERDVDDELRPTADDAREVPTANIQQPLPNDPTHLSDLHDDRSQTFMHQDTSSATSRPEPINEMRGALMNTFQKAIHLRYPHLNVDIDKLRERFARKLTDAEVQDFIRMGRNVVEDLKRNGKIEEARRKLATQEQDDDNEARRNRRRIDGTPSPVRNDFKSSGGVDVSHHSSDLFAVERATVASTTTPTDQNGGPLSSNGPAAEGPSTPIHSTAQQGASPPPYPDEDVFMSISPPPQRSPGSPHSRRLSILSSPDLHKDDFAPPHTNTQTADAQLHSHEPADQDTMDTDDTTISDFGAPRILAAKVGQPIADVTDVSFDVNEQLFIAARRWTQCTSKEYDPSALHMRLYLTSIPTAAAENAHRELPPDSPASHLAEAVAKINVVWPPPRTFYVSLNGGYPEATSWGDQFFGPSSPPLDISNCVMSGKNTIRLIQLEDLSERLFLILAVPLSEWEKQKRATWKKQLAQHMTSNTIKVRFKP